MTHLFYATFLLAVLVFKTDACLFPSDLANGTWYSSTKGVLNISSNSANTSITGYTFDKFGAVDLTCWHSSGDSYVFRSSVVSIFGLSFYGYVCFVLNQQSSSKFIYHIGSEVNTDADNERIKTILVTITTAQTVSTICDRSSYPVGSENMFLKNDGNEADEKVTFPYELRGNWNYIFNSGSGDLCGTSSDLDTCDSPDSSTLTFNYTTCSTIQAYSATGVLYLMWYTYTNGHYYMIVYNTDETTDESNTYRFTCYILQLSGTTLYATQHPQECSLTQNATYVPSPGATIVFDQTGGCPFDTSSTVISTAATAGIIIAVLVLVAIVVTGVVLCYYYKKRKEKEARDKLPVKKSEPANKRLANGHLFKDTKVRDANMNNLQTPSKTQNGDVKINLDDIAGIRREDSICISMTSRGPSVMPGQSETESRNGPAPVEEPEKSSKGPKKSRPKTGNKYLVDSARDQRLRSSDKGALRTPANEQRRRFGDPPTSSNRKKTPRLRHPMEDQGEGEDPQEQKQKEIRQNKKEVSGQEEKRARSGRRRTQGEPSNIEPVREDPFDHRERPFKASTFSEARGGKSAGLRLDRENSAFLDQKSIKQPEVDVWNKVSNMWLFKNQPHYGNPGK